MKRLKKKIVSHLKDDIKGYSKQRKHLKEEMKEDKDLIKKLKKKKK
jgi:hypothetical protein